MNEHSFIIYMPRLSYHARKALVQERQQQILQAAAQVFAEKGFDAATIRDVARAAGVAEGSIYLYFKNKQDLLVHLPRQFMLPPVEAFHAAANRSAAPVSPDALLQFVAENIVTVVQHNRDLIRVLFTTLPNLDEQTRAAYLREGPGYAVERIEEYIRAQQAAGIFRADVNPEIAARALPGMLLFFLLVQEVLQPADMPRFEYRDVIPVVVQIYLRGMMQDAPISKKTAMPNRKSKTASKPKTRSKRTTRKQIITIE